MIACINGGPVETIDRSLVDHQYFYEEGGFGKYACGVARIAAAKQLRYYGVSRFGDAGCLSALNHYISNPSVTGFILEQAVLSSITSRGLDISREISGPMKAIMFLGNVTIFDENESGPALYWLMQFNYPAVDGIIVRFDHSNKGKKCSIVCMSEETTPLSVAPDAVASPPTCSTLAAFAGSRPDTKALRHRA